MTRVSITHMNNNHSDWLRGLDFYKEELGIMSKRLTEVAGKNTSHEAGAEIEHFENQFKVQNEATDQLRHDINAHASSLAQQLQTHSSAGYVEGDSLTKHNALQERYASSEKIVNELRHSFNQFAAKWM